ncbi:MAG: hypothetical protein ACP5P2_02300 [Candidatus Micrarchaeia archaeon]|jgi:hypothetical protein
MLKLSLVSIDMLLSLPILILIFGLLYESKNIVYTSSEQLTLLADRLLHYSTSQVATEYCNARLGERTMPINASCYGCRIVTCKGLTYKMVID